MSTHLGLELSLKQGLVMTQAMQQAVKLLQYNRQELVTHIHEQVLENPTLEIASLDADFSASGDDASSDSPKPDAANDDLPDDGVWDRFLERELARSPMRSEAGGTDADDRPLPEANLTYAASLADHLLFQLHMTRNSPAIVQAAEAIIYNLDHRGYLRSPVAELSESLGQSTDQVEAARQVVLGFDPLGCGALDLSECLVSQARVHVPGDPHIVSILMHELHKLEHRNYTAIARSQGIDVEDVIEYHRMIRHLEPHPGRQFSTEEPRYIVPDFQVFKNVDGQWVVIVNDEGVPDLRVSAFYRTIVRTASKSDRQYLLDKLRGAEFFIKSIHKRQFTVRRVMESILRHQRDFFERGANYLRPLVLQDVADDIGVHMSTVSRATSNKYVHTPLGVYPLKYFFSVGIPQQTGNSLSSEHIKSQIKQLLGSENPLSPYSDQGIANHLNAQGIRVARRTVAKYREQLGILPSSQRKKAF